MQMAVPENRELLQVAEAVAREKGLDRESILEAMENAIQVAGRRKYGHDLNIKAEIDRRSGEMRLFRERAVVEVVENAATEMTLAEAKKIDPALEIGDATRDLLPAIELGRIAAQAAKQVIIQKVRDVERDRQYEEFKDRVGDIISAVVKRVEFGNVYVEMNGAEAVIRRDETIQREQFRPGERVRAYIYDVRREKSGPQVYLSRTHPVFMAKLFAQEVPEIYDGVIEIKAVARDPGSRAKICVLSHDNNIDPVGSCVGVRGVRVQAVIAELQGERVDILPWSSDPATLVVSALAPATVTRVVIDEEAHKLIAAVPEDELSQAIGRRGQNVRLASQLLGWDIDVMTEADESKMRVEDFAAATKLFTTALDVEDVIAELLASEGFRKVEEVAQAQPGEIAAIEGFDDDVEAELIRRAATFLQDERERMEAELRTLGVSPALLELPGMSSAILTALGKQGVKTLDDVADLSRDEFKEFVPGAGLPNKEIDRMIMAARAHWFEDEEGKEAVNG